MGVKPPSLTTEAKAYPMVCWSKSYFSGAEPILPGRSIFNCDTTPIFYTGERLQITDKEQMMKTIQVEVPEQLYKKVLHLVKKGWFRDENDILAEAIRRYLDTHQSDLMEKYIRDDVDWGLHGND